MVDDQREEPESSATVAGPTSFPLRGQPRRTHPARWRFRGRSPEGRPQRNTTLRGVLSLEAASEGKAAAKPPLTRAGGRRRPSAGIPRQINFEGESGQLAVNVCRKIQRFNETLSDF